MIGRGALINPFLPGTIRNGKDGSADRVEEFRAFYDDLFEHYRIEFHGPGHLLDRMKGFWTYFSQSFKDGHKIKKKIHRTPKLDRYLKIVDRFFEEDAEWNR